MKNKLILATIGVVVLVAGVAFILFRNSSNSSSSSTSSSSVATENNQTGSTQIETKKTDIAKVAIVSACKELTVAELKTVYPDKTFYIKEDRNNPPTIYDAISLCNYQDSETLKLDTYNINFEVRAKDSASNAKQLLLNAKDLIAEGRASRVDGLGDEAYYLDYGVTSGGPRLEWVKGSVYYKINIQSVKTGDAEKIKDYALKIAGQI
jgi:hypothetical protein